MCRRIERASQSHDIGGVPLDGVQIVGGKNITHREGRFLTGIVQSLGNTTHWQQQNGGEKDLYENPTKASLFEGNHPARSGSVQKGFHKKCHLLTYQAVSPAA